MGIKVFLSTGWRFICLKCELVILESVQLIASVGFNVILWGNYNFQSYCHEKVLVLATYRPKLFF